MTAPPRLSAGEPLGNGTEAVPYISLVVAAFGGIAPTYRIALLDKPTIVWDFHSLLIGLQMMFSFMMAEDKTPLRMCDCCDTIFVATRKTQRFCCDKCRRKGE